MSAVLDRTEETTPGTSQASLLAPADSVLQPPSASATGPDDAAGPGSSGEGAGAGDASSAGSAGAAGDGEGGAGDSKGMSPQEIIKKIDDETAEAIRKIQEDAARRKALAVKKAIPLPQRKTAAFDFLEVERDRMRNALGQPLLADADVDAHIKSALDSWYAQRA